MPGKEPFEPEIAGIGRFLQKEAAWLRSCEAYAARVENRQPGDTARLGKIYRCMQILSEGFSECPQWAEACACNRCKSYAAE